MALKKGGSKKDVDQSEEVEFELHASTLDEQTHNELNMLYAESTETLRFVKSHQWRTVGSTLLTYGGLILIAVVVKADAALINKLEAITILLATSVVFTLIIYQFWTHNEQNKLDFMEYYYSNLFRDIRAMKSRLEGNLHRYTLLLFMAVVVVLGAVVVHFSLARLETL
jgi:hypothetical protein